jgi:hypothetical protein
MISALPGEGASETALAAAAGLAWFIIFVDFFKRL